MSRPFTACEPAQHQPPQVAVLLLRTLGSVGLLQRTPAGEQHVDVQQKRLALLVFLARRVPTSVRRDIVLPLFWPEADEQHGRGVLRQALSSFRRQLGPDVLVTHGEHEIGLSAHAITCDALEFEAACAAGSHEKASALYGGDFLAGFHVAGVAAEFEQWVDAERDRLRRLAVGAAWGMARASDERGSPGEAVRWARRAVELEPADEAGVARLIALLDRKGDRAGALVVYAALQRRLKDEFAAQPSPETRALVQALHQRPLASPVALEEASAPVARAPVPMPAVPQAFRLRKRMFLAGAAGAIATVSLFALLAPSRPVRQAPARTARILAVTPFRVHSSDAGLSWLGDGMAELLTMRLSGTEDLTTVDPGRVLAAWHRHPPDSQGEVSGESLREFARDLHAERIVRGSITGTSANLVLAAWVITLPDGRIEAQASVQGSVDTLPALVDRLSVTLLGLASGVEGHRLLSLQGVSPPAIRAFLAGRAAFRRGRPDEAVVHFRDAVTLDSTFALAGLDLRRASGWTKGQADMALGARVVRANKERLSVPDRALYEVMQGQWLGAHEMFTKWNAAVAAYPDRPETWYGLADSYYHWGMLAGIENALARAERAFRRGWMLDSAANGSAALAGPLIAETMDHLVVLAHLRGDTAEVLRLSALVLASDSSGDLARKVAWHGAAVRGRAERRAFWDHPGDGIKPVMGLVLFTLWTPVAAEDHAMAAREIKRRLELHDPGFRSFALFFEAYNGGRPSEASPAATEDRGRRRQLEVAAWWGGDPTAADSAALQLGRTLALSHAASSPSHYRDACRLGLWRGGQGDANAVELAAERMRAGPVTGSGEQDSAAVEQVRRLCAALLDASSSVLRGRGDARARVAVGDSLARDLIFVVCCGDGISDANLVLAHLWERLGDRPLALRAIRRRAGGFMLGPLYLSTFLREEGRLLTLQGDTTGAIAAYQHYLAMRPDPEATLRAEVDGVRRQVAALGALPMVASAP